MESGLIDILMDFQHKKRKIKMIQRGRNFLPKKRKRFSVDEMRCKKIVHFF